MRIGTIVISVVTLWIVTGCAAQGPYFNRAQLEALPLGKATRAEIRSVLGEPYSENYRVVAANDPSPAEPNNAFAPALLGGSHAVLIYLYLDRRKGPLIGTYYSEQHTPGKMAVFEFWNERLIGYSLLSDFAEDFSDFDDTRVGELVKGKTTRAEVLRLLGSPNGRSVDPRFPRPRGDSFIYHHVDVDRPHFEERRKRLDILFDENDVVRDFRFVADVKPIPTTTGLGHGYSVAHNLDFFLGRKTGW